MHFTSDLHVAQIWHVYLMCMQVILEFAWCGDTENLLLWNIHRRLILQYNCKVQISKTLLLRYKQYNYVFCGSGQGLALLSAHCAEFLFLLRYITVSWCNF